jgi:hypothetical protein
LIQHEGPLTVPGQIAGIGQVDPGVVQGEAEMPSGIGYPQVEEQAEEGDDGVQGQPLRFPFLSCCVDQFRLPF